MEHEPPTIWCAGEIWCPVTATTTLIGGKWHPVVILQLFKNDGLGFNALQDEIAGVSNKVLSETLEDLEEKALINREIVNEKPVRVEYSLTPFGASLEPVIGAMAVWGSENLQAPEGMEELSFP